MTDDFWANSFHWCALAAGFIAAGEGRLEDSAYVRDLAYSMFEEGAFRDRCRPCSRPRAEECLNTMSARIQNVPRTP